MDESSTNNLEKYLQDQVDRQNVYGKTNKKKRTCKAGDSNYGIAKKRSKKLKEFIGNTDDLSNALPCSSNEDNNILDKRKFERLKQIRINENDKFKNIDENEFSSPIVKNDKPISKAVIYSDDENILDNENIYDSDYKPTEDEYISSNEECEENSKKIKLVVNTKVNVIKKNRKSISKGIKLKDKKRKIKDDGNLEDYKKRILKWKKGEALKTLIEYSDLLEEDNFKEFDGGFKLPLVIWDKLYLYQKTGVHWLWELHCQRCGGILGDEMGLGKTIQVIAFLVGISYSKMIQTGYKWKGLGPILIVSPTTILHQWVKEFHRWWPLFRVAILHESGSFKGKRAALIHNINRYGGILITSYTGLRDQIKILLQYDWHYFILDEGHKIRNPESQITIAVKRFTTPHKIILSGSPIQNSLKELWSLFDFVFPGKLGTIEVFLQQFSVPITRGGYVNASKLEVQTAYRCAIILRDTISPYLLRRLKSDVMHHLNLPDKTEQVLFCALTDEQRSLYRDYISGKEVDCILKGRLRVFVGLIILRKICNHPDLYSFFPSDDINESAASYGWWKRSGKMLVLHAILKLWNSQGHRVLLFSQSKKMMDILEKFIKDQGYTYMKMDGSTNIGSRQRLIDVFNDDSSVFVFLLTTRVGGLGVNLIGANRVVIFDPDWNPSTDIQARERAWRIGQTKEVTVYRLLTAGTIEEKIYHRQIFKQFLTNRILKNPKQQRFFKSNDLYELFTLNEGDKEKTESSAIFAGTGSEIKFKKHKRSQYKHRRESSKTQEIFKLGEKDTKVLMSHTCSDMLNDEELEKPVCEFDFITKETNIQDQKPEDPNYPVQISNDLNNLDQKPEDPNDPVYISNDLNNLDQKPEDPNDPVYISNDLNNLDQKSEDPNDPVHKSHSQNILDQNDLVHISDESKTLEENQEFSNCLAQESADITSPDKKCNDFIMELDFNGDFEDGEILEDESINLENVGSIDVDAKENSEIKTLYQNTQSSSGFQALLDVRIHDEKKEKMMQLAKLLSKKIAENKLLSKPTDDKNSKEKRKKKKGKVFEGERIEHLVKKRAYNPDKNLDKEEEERKAVNKAQDEFLLAKLFKKSRVHTALSHDAIVNSSDPDYLILENEAERVAKEAMKQVRMSRNNYVRPSANLGHKKKPRFGRESSSFHKTILLKTKKDIELQIEDSKATASSVSNILKNNTKSDNIGVSNMTTSSKDMPNPNSLLSENFFGNSKISFGDNNLSSSNLLSQIKARNRPIDHIQQNNNARRTVNDEENYDSAYPSTAETYVNEEINESNEHIELLNDIRCFVAFQACIDGSASTEEIVEKFKDRLPNNHSHIFRALLKEICEFRRNSSGIGMWHIKNELR